MLFRFRYTSYNIDREITKLNLRAIEHKVPETTINVYLEMKKRIAIFIEKWDRILWIKDYANANGKEPHEAVVSNEFTVSQQVAASLIQEYRDMDRNMERDFNMLLADYNVYDDAMIWFTELLLLLNSGSVTIILHWNCFDCSKVDTIIHQ